jgi:hypothetical protein
MSCQGAIILEIFRLSNQLTINKQCNLTLSFKKTHARNDHVKLLNIIKLQKHSLIVKVTSFR